jgi:hypothetical protein
MRRGVALGVLVIAAAIAASLASGAEGPPKGPPPPPKTAGGQPAAVVARGIPTPTTFAWGAGHLFVAAFGSEEKPMVPGGVFIVSGGAARKLPGAPPPVLGGAG